LGTDPSNHWKFTILVDFSPRTDNPLITIPFPLFVFRWNLDASPKRLSKYHLVSSLDFDIFEHVLIIQRAGLPKAGVLVMFCTEIANP
jgi:hypothetical protein